MKKVIVVFAAVLSLTTSFAQEKKQKHKSKHKIEQSGTETKVKEKEKKSGDAAAATTSVQAGANDAAKAPIEFKESKFSFGKIKQGTPVTHIFKFKNVSNGPVFIENATAQCGCTTPEYNKGAIAKGASENIKVTYNAASMGAFTKTVTVRVAKFQDPIILTIEGEVIPKENAEEKKGK